METLIIALKKEKARKLLQDLEELEIIEVMDKPRPDKNSKLFKVSELKNQIVTRMKEVAIDNQLREIRNEWQPNIQ